jgi:hypothetical protein
MLLILIVNLDWVEDKGSLDWALGLEGVELQLVPLELQLVPLERKKVVSNLREVPLPLPLRNFGRGGYLRPLRTLSFAP